MMRKVAALAGLACMLTSHLASAALLTYTTEESFVGGMTGGQVKIESLDTFASGFTPPAGGSTLSFAGGSSPLAVTGTLTGQDSMRSKLFPNAGRTAKDGNIYWQGGTTAGSSFAITFSAAVDAFGFWASDIGDFGTDCSGCSSPPSGNVLRIEFFLGSASVEVFETAGNAANASMDFYGFARGDGQTFDKVVFTNLTIGIDGRAADGQGFDRFMIGDAQATTPPPSVPEPGMLGLFSLGLLAAARARRRS